MARKRFESRITDDGRVCNFDARMANAADSVLDQCRAFGIENSEELSIILSSLEDAFNDMMDIGYNEAMKTRARCKAA